MKDLDFEELDRAVTSLTNEQKEPSASEYRPKDTAQEVGGAQTEMLPSSPDKVVDDPELDKLPVPPSSAHPMMNLTPSHRSGRLDFRRPNTGVPRGVIDIMAPKPAQPKPLLPVRSPSHVGVTMQPTANHEGFKPSPSLTPETEPVDDTTADQAKLKQVQDQLMATAKEREQPAGDEKWPDPLDFNGNPRAEEEQGSPFLPGAKVAKRPLGAYAEYASEPEEKPKETTDEGLAETLVMAPIEPDGVPENVSPKEIAVSDEPILSEPVAEETSSQPEEEKDNESEPLLQRPAEQQVRDSAMLSIPQQYRAPNKTASMSTRPIFDTKEYHPPLLEEISQTSRNRRMWLWLVIGLVIVIAVAVGGYFVFTYFVQR